MGISQRDLAERLGLAQSYVSRVEHGNENLTVSTCERFALAVGCIYSSELVFSFTTVRADHRDIGDVTLWVCERFAHALGAVYSSALCKISR